MAKEAVNERRSKGRKYKHKSRAKVNDNYERKKSYKQKKQNQNADEKIESTAKWFTVTRDLPMLRGDDPESLRMNIKVYQAFFGDRLVSWCCRKEKMPDSWTKYLHHSTQMEVFDTEMECGEIPPQPEPVNETDNANDPVYALARVRWAQADKKRVQHNYDLKREITQHKITLYHLIRGNIHPDYTKQLDLTPEGASAKLSHDPWELIKAIMVNCRKTLEANWTEQFMEDKKNYLKCSQYQTETLGVYHERYMAAYNAYRRSYDLVSKNEAIRWAGENWDEVYGGGRNPEARAILALALQDENFRDGATTMLSKFESCKHFVQGMFTKGMDTIPKAVAIEAQILFKGGAISIAMNKYKAECGEGKEPFHPTTVYTYLNEIIKVRMLNPTMEDKMRESFVPKRTFTDFSTALETGRGAFVTKVKGDKPKGKGDKSKGNGDDAKTNGAKTSEKGKRDEKGREDRRDSDERSKGITQINSSRSRGDDGDGRRLNLASSHACDDNGGGLRNVREKNGTRYAGRDRSASRERGDSRDRGNRGNVYDRVSGYNNNTQRRKNDDRDEGRAFKRSRTDERDFRGRSPDRQVSQGRGQQDRDACRGCGRNGHWWKEGVCAEGRALIKDGWGGRGRKPSVRDSQSNGRWGDGERSESEDSRQSR